MEIDRDLAERLLEFVKARSNSEYALSLHDKLQAALSATAEPLTADECRAFAGRIRALPTIDDIRLVNASAIVLGIAACIDYAHAYRTSAVPEITATQSCDAVQELP